MHIVSKIKSQKRGMQKSQFGQSVSCGQSEVEKTSFPEFPPTDCILLAQ